MPKAFDLQEWASQPIPDIPSVDGWKEVPIAENGEPLVSLRELGIPSVSFYKGTFHNSPYEADALTGSLHEVYVREDFGEKLLTAQSSLPAHMTVIGLDGLRQTRLQASLFEYYVEQLREINPEWSAEELEKHAQDYVSKPSDDPLKPAPHKTGGSLDSWLLSLPDGYSRHDINVDVAVRLGFWLPAGAAFDHGGEMAALRYWEDQEDIGARAFRANRRVQYWMMREAGIEVYAPEYWHTNYGNQMAAQSAGLPNAIYGAVELSPVQQAHEARLQTRTNQTPRKALTNLPLGEIIAPV